MTETSILVVNKLGLHARAASKLVKLCAGFSSTVKFSLAGQEVDGKSIMGLLMFAAAQGTELQLKVDGEDEQDALEAIRTLFADRFGEEE